jgi:hypothetical protein
VRSKRSDPLVTDRRVVHLRTFAAIGIVCCTLFAGCAVSPTAFVDDPIIRETQNASAEVRECLNWFAKLDAAVASAGVRDAQDSPIAGFPHLRVNRLLSSYRTQIKSDAAFIAWLEHFRSLDAAARHVEITNLPLDTPSPFAAFAAFAATDRAAARDRVTQCGATLTQHDLASPARRAAIVERAVVADDYSDALRVAGAYAIARYAFSVGIKQLEAQTIAAFVASRQGDALTSPIQRYEPPVSAPRESVAAIVSAAPRDALGIPQFTETNRTALLAAHAPIIEVETTGDYDRVGRPMWSAAKPALDTARPTVFARQTFTRYGDATLVQLVYTAWFSERPAAHAFDVLAGALDGIVLRVTLAPNGEPIIYDSIHPCGCYHMFFPTPRVKARAAPNAVEEWAFSPATLPRIGNNERVKIRVASRTHYLTNLVTEEANGSSLQNIERITYSLANDDELRTIPQPDGSSKSLFGTDGIVAGTERPERAFFWPTGIANAGAMRQSGRHATAFVGRRHFDDADLMERRFEIDLNGQ